MFAFQTESINNIDQVIWSFPTNQFGQFMSKLYEVGQMGFVIMIPIFAGGIAYSIGGVGAIAPAVINGLLINNPEFLETESGAGFMGAILIGMSVGYSVSFLQGKKWPKMMKELMRTFVVPVFITILFCAVTYYLVGKPIAYMMNLIYYWINYITVTFSGAPLIYGVILGAMVDVDLGGPINKTAILISSAIFIDTMNSGQIMRVNALPQAATAAAISVAPIGAAIYTYFYPKDDDSMNRQLAVSTFLMSLMGVSEAAISYAVLNPKFIIANTISSALAGGLVGFLKIQFYGGIASPLGILVGYMDGPLMPRLAWVLIIFGAAIFNAVLYYRIEKGKII